MAHQKCGVALRTPGARRDGGPPCREPGPGPVPRPAVGHDWHDGPRQTDNISGQSDDIPAWPPPVAAPSILGRRRSSRRRTDTGTRPPPSRRLPVSNPPGGRTDTGRGPAGPTPPREGTQAGCRVRTTPGPDSHWTTTPSRHHPTYPDRPVLYPCLSPADGEREDRTREPSAAEGARRTRTDDEDPDRAWNKREEEGRSTGPLRPGNPTDLNFPCTRGLTDVPMDGSSAARRYPTPSPCHRPSSSSVRRVLTRRTHDRGPPRPPHPEPDRHTQTAPRLSPRNRKSPLSSPLPLGPLPPGRAL